MMTWNSSSLRAAMTELDHFTGNTSGLIFQEFGSITLVDAAVTWRQGGPERSVA
jgi:hypothetical protein